MCEIISKKILLPSLDMITPHIFNSFILAVSTHSLHSIITSLTLQIAMSNQSFLNTALTPQYIHMRDDGRQYVAPCLSRFQAETILLHAPTGSFLIRSCHPFSRVYHLSYCCEMSIVFEVKSKMKLSVIHELIEQTDQNTYLCECLHDEMIIS